MRAVVVVILLAGSAVATADSHAPLPMQGPFASIVDYCKKGLDIYQDKEVRAILEPRCEDSIRELAPESPLKLTGAYQDLRVYDVPENALRVLAVKVGGQWYMQDLAPFEDPPNCHGGTAFSGVTERSGSLQIDYSINGNCERRDHEWKWSERSFVVLGIGASKKPSVTPPFQTSITETTTNAKPNKRTLSVTRSAKWGKDGSLDVATRGAVDPSTPQRIEPAVGHHTFAFP